MASFPFNVALQPNFHERWDGDRGGASTPFPSHYRDPPPGSPLFPSSPTHFIEKKREGADEIRRVSVSLQQGRIRVRMKARQDENRGERDGLSLRVGNRGSLEEPRGGEPLHTLPIPPALNR